MVDGKIEDLKQLYQTRAQLLEEMQRRLQSVDVQVQVDLTSGVLRLGEGILFKSQDPNITPEGRTNIQKLGVVLGEVLPCYLGPNVRRPPTCTPIPDVTLESVFIEGHADSSGPVDKNWELSVNRAISTYRELDRQPSKVTLLVNPAQQHLFSVSGYGSFRPVDVNSTPVGRAANRRIDLRFNMQVDPRGALEEIRAELRKVLSR